MTSNFSHETHQIDKQNALNIKKYVVGVKNDKNGSQFAKLGRLIIAILSSEWGRGGGTSPSKYSPLCKLNYGIPALKAKGLVFCLSMNINFFCALQLCNWG